MGERKENSVLFSLRELQSIEQDRVQEEVSAKEQAERERVQAQIEAEQRALAEAEAQRQAAENAERQRREEIERHQREEQLAIEAQQRLQQVELQAKVERERLAQEMAALAHEASNKRPTMLIGLAVLLVGAIAGLAVFLSNKSEQDEARQRALQAKVEEAKLAIEEKQVAITRLVEEKDQHYEGILKSQTPEEKEAAQGKLDAVNKKIQAEKRALAELQRTLEQLSTTGLPDEEIPESGEGEAPPEGEASE